MTSIEVADRIVTALEQADFRKLEFLYNSAYPNHPIRFNPDTFLYHELNVDQEED